MERKKSKIWETTKWIPKEKGYYDGEDKDRQITDNNDIDR